MGFPIIFFEIQITGHLFHLKQASFREAQSQGLIKSEFKESPTEVLSKLKKGNYKNRVEKSVFCRFFRFKKKN